MFKISFVEGREMRGNGWVEEGRCEERGEGEGEERMVNRQMSPREGDGSLSLLKE